MLRSSVGMDLTRRGLLARAAAASGALIAGRALEPGVVLAGPGGEAVFQLALPRGAGSGGGWHSGPVTAPRGFELLGVEAGSRGGHPEIEVRARSANGRWSEWLPAHAGHGHGPDADAGTLSDPVWTGPAQVFEVRARRPLAGARVVLVSSGAPATAAAAKQYVDAGLQAAAGQPKIIARSSWATAACRPRLAAGLGMVNLAFVHHTVNSNVYSPSQSAGMVRAICLFHKYGNGWDDIGYNFVVDRYGQVFEGRAGGIDEAVVGAHAGGYNLYSSGVALLGTFASSGPPRRMFDALAHVLAWKLSIHGIPVAGTSTVRVTKDGAAYSRYRAGTPVTLNHISGHRDGDTTECPGSAMYRQLPRLRQSAGRLATSLTALSFDITGVAPGSVNVSGQLASDSVGIGGATIEIQSRSTAHGASTLLTATTNPDGTWAATIPLTTNTALRAIFRGDGNHAAIISPGQYAAVPPQVNLTAATQLVAPGGTVEFDGSTVPAKPKVALVVSQQQPDGTFTTVRTITFGANPDGTFTRTVGFPNAGQFQVVAHTSADSSNALGTSAPVNVTVA